MTTENQSKVPSMLDKLFPKRINNVFPGHKVAFYAFVAVTLGTLNIGVHRLTAFDYRIEIFESIPLDDYSAGAASTIVGVFALWGLSQVIVGCVYLLACVYYRSLIPMLYLLLIFEYLTKYLIDPYSGMDREDLLPSSIINISVAIVGIILLIICLVTKSQQVDIPRWLTRFFGRR